MNRLIFVLITLVALGCARVRVETVEPIKVDINMRVDIYQHVAEEVQSINDQIYGTDMDVNFLFSLIEDAYAADNTGLTAAISRRKNRLKQIEEYFVLGYLGENRYALLELRAQVPPSEEAKIKEVISRENSDRQTIYKATAEKNEISISEAQKIFFEDDYKRALGGFLFEVLKDGKYVWQTK